MVDEYTLASRHFQAGNWQLAEQLYRQVLQGNPGHFDALNFLGIALVQQGRLEEAAQAMQQASIIQPNDADTINDLGSVHFMRGDLNAAVDCFRQALHLRPDHARALYNLGLALQHQQKLEEAIVCYQRAIALLPSHVNAHINLGAALSKVRRFEEAIACYRQLLLQQPTLADGHANLGKVLAEARRWDDAIASYRQALHLQPNSADVHFALSIAMTEQCRFDEALACCENALRFDPRHALAHLNRAFMWLLAGKWTDGWREFEWRHLAKGGPQTTFPQPRWDGSPLAGRTLLVHTEEGLGDSLHFFRYVKLLRDQGHRVLLQCQPALEKLLGHNLGMANLASHAAALPAFDVHVPILSLPGICGSVPANIPFPGQYLSADEATVRDWRGRLASVEGLKVGIAWQGNPTFGSDRERSIPLAFFKALAQVPGVQLISMQKGPAAEQVRDVQSQFRLHDVSGQIDDFIDTAAIMKNLDLVVCCDTSVAHLAGALGVPVWVALAIRPDWRWQLQREDSPWYASMRLFRQSQAGVWHDVFERMAGVLRFIK